MYYLSIFSQHILWRLLYVWQCLHARHSPHPQSLLYALPPSTATASPRAPSFLASPSASTTVLYVASPAASTPALYVASPAASGAGVPLYAMSPGAPGAPGSTTALYAATPGAPDAAMVDIDLASVPRL